MRLNLSYVSPKLRFLGDGEELFEITLGPDFTEQLIGELDFCLRSQSTGSFYEGSLMLDFDFKDINNCKIIHSADDGKTKNTYVFDCAPDRMTLMTITFNSIKSGIITRRERMYSRTNMLIEYSDKLVIRDTSKSRPDFTLDLSREEARTLISDFYHCFINMSACTTKVGKYSIDMSGRYGSGPSTRSFKFLFIGVQDVSGKRNIGLGYRTYGKYYEAESLEEGLRNAMNSI